MKQALYKCVSKANLYWDELVEVLLDVETILNNQPLSYVKDDLEMPVLTPNLMLYGEPTKQLLEKNEISTNDKELRRRTKYLKRCKGATWQRWRSEYLQGLRERHNMISKENHNATIKEVDVLMIKGD